MLTEEETSNISNLPNLNSLLLAPRPAQSFADEIGADGYSKDAAECVKLVERLLSL